ncbi:MAG: glycosyltransferase family 2 protein [Theionarchaea archaeon]|nr:glycosyltransferase family 2 protein [Theionarchaea archaeon]
MISYYFICILFVMVILYDSYYFIIFLYQSFKKNEIQYLPPISVIVPVYNNETTIRKCIQSIIDSEYSEKEIVVVNDGSTDKTEEILTSLVGLTLYSIPHSGKATALNYGITHSLYDIIIIDADTLIEKDTLKKLASSLGMYDAVAGNLQVSNPRGFIGRCQAIEHVRVAMFRKVSQYFNDIDIVPGPIGAFKKEIFTHIKYGYSLVEDMELTQKLKEKNYTVGYQQEARAYTEMPATWKSFLGQRFRWAKGNVDLLLKRKISFKKVLTGYILAFADLLLVASCVVTQNYFFLFLFFLFESFTMIMGTYREKTRYYLESVIFPVFMLFLDGIFLLSHFYGFLSLLKRS